MGGKFVGGSDDTIKLLDAGKLLEQGQGGGSALPQELQQAVDKANKDFEVASSPAIANELYAASIGICRRRRRVGRCFSPKVLTGCSCSFAGMLHARQCSLAGGVVAILCVVSLTTKLTISINMKEKQREASVPPGLSMEQFEAAKAVAKDMLAASSQLFALHWAGCVSFASGIWIGAHRKTHWKL